MWNEKRNVSDPFGLDPFGLALNGWKVDVYGTDLNETNTSLATAGEAPVISATGNNEYFYTDEFAAAPGWRMAA